MPKQRTIREKALLSLFSSATLEPKAIEEDTLWELVLEPELAAIDKLLIKTLKHQLKAYQKWENELVEVAPGIVSLLKTYEHKSAARQLTSTTKDVLSLGEYLSMLSGRTSKKELNTTFSKGNALHHALQSLKTNLQETPYEAPLKPQLEKSLSQLLDLTQRLRHIHEPLEHPGEKSVAPLSKELTEVNTLRTEATILAKGTLENLEQIDEKIREHLTNFSLEQIGKVERNLLRLGTYEILILEQPKGIVINEALEIAKRFATDDAAPLINGVLDKIA